jgi:MFS family permease
MDVVDKPPHASRALWATATVFFLTGTVFGTWAGRIPAVKADLRLTDGELAVAFLALEGAAVVGLQLGGVLVSRFYSRAALIWALPLFGVGLLGLGLSVNLVMLSAALAVWAVANSVVDVAMNASGVAVQHHLNRSVMSRLHAMHPLGGIVGAGIGAAAAHAGVPVEVHFAAVGAVVAVLASVSTRALLDVAAERDTDAGADRGTHVRATPDWRSGWSRPLLIVGVMAFCLTFAEGAANNWSAVYLSYLDASPSLAASVVAVFLALMAAGRLAGDRLIIRFGPSAVFGGGASVAGLGMAAGLVVSHPAAGFAGLALLGLGLSVTVPITISAAGRMPQLPTAVAVSRVATMGYLGSFVGPAVIGVLAEGVGLSWALALPVTLILATVPIRRLMERSVPAPPTGPIGGRR